MEERLYVDSLIGFRRDGKIKQKWKTRGRGRKDRRKKSMVHPKFLANVATCSHTQRTARIFVVRILGNHKNVFSESRRPFDHVV